MTALAVDRLSVPFGPARGLDAVSFALDPGESLAIVGASGAGKTSLLRAIAGLAPVAGGRVHVGGRDVTAEPPERRGAVYLHQTPLLFPHLSVAQNVAFALDVRRTPAPDVERRVREALGVVRLDGFGHRAPHTLSGGQRQRVALARAIAARPPVLLLDEPLASLDPSLRDEVRGAIVALQREYQPALVIVTHDFAEAGAMAGQIGVLLDRRIAQLAPPAELFTQPASSAVARFLGMANEVPGRLAPDGRLDSALGPLSLPVSGIPAGAVDVFCRAEAVRLVADGGVAAQVVELRHRPEGTTAVLDVGGTQIEAGVDSLGPPRIGAVARFVVDPRGLVVFARSGS